MTMFCHQEILHPPGQREGGPIYSSLLVSFNSSGLGQSLLEDSPRSAIASPQSGLRMGSCLMSGGEDKCSIPTLVSLSKGSPWVFHEASTPQPREGQLLGDTSVGSQQGRSGVRRDSFFY